MRVPCGRCTACKIAHSREWAVRLVHEMHYAKQSTFLTLTYSDQFGPINPSLSKRHLQLFFKRLRKSLNTPIKHFSSGEYGDTNGRPHYHSIVIGYAPDDILFDTKLKANRSSYIESIWKYGHVIVGSVTYDSCRYVCDYTFKKYNSKYNKEIYGDKQPPFQLQSIGIGKKYLDDNWKQIVDNGEITINGKQVGIPLYYKRNLVLYAQDSYDKARQHKDDLKEHYGVADSDDDEDFLKAYFIAIEQSAKNIEARESLKKQKKL